MTDPAACSSSRGDARDTVDTPHVSAISPNAIPCPTCSRVGKVVPGQTIKAMLAVSLRLVRDTEYLFCRTPGCPVVYFSRDGDDQFTLDQVRERVYHKEPEEASISICYCFRHTVGEIHTASAETRAAILADITEGIRAGQCACDLRNPQGVCCLGMVRKHIKGTHP